MNRRWFRYLFVIVFLCFTSVVTHASKEASRKSAENRMWKDGKIVLTIDKIMRSDAFPPEVLKKLSGTKPFLPKKRHKFLFIYLTIHKIEGIIMGLPTKKCIIIDDANKEYKPGYFYFPIRLKNPKDLTSGGHISSGTSGIIWFNIGENSNPTKFHFSYNYWNSIDDKKKKVSAIDIYFK